MTNGIVGDRIALDHKQCKHRRDTFCISAGSNNSANAHSRCDRQSAQVLGALSWIETSNSLELGEIPILRPDLVDTVLAH